MSLIVETPYVTFTITKKNEKPLTIRDILGVNLYKCVKEGEFTLIENCILTVNSYDIAYHIKIEIDHGGIDWAMYSDNIYCSRDMLYAMQCMQEYKKDLPIDLPKGINAYINFGDLCVDIDPSVYDMDFKLNEQRIESDNLMLRYQNINLEATDHRMIKEKFDILFDNLMLILKPKNYCLRHTEALSWKHLENNKYTYTGNLETLKELTISINTPDPTPDQEISLYKLIQYAFKGIKNIDYRIFILIDNTVLDTVIHDNKIELNLKT